MISAGILSIYSMGSRLGSLHAALEGYLQIPPLQGSHARHEHEKSRHRKKQRGERFVKDPARVEVRTEDVSTRSVPEKGPVGRRITANDKQSSRKIEKSTSARRSAMPDGEFLAARDWCQ